MWTYLRIDYKENEWESDKISIKISDMQRIDLETSHSENLLSERDYENMANFI